MQDDSTLFSCDEVWRDVVGYEGLYQVSNYGRVKSLDRIVIKKNGNPLHIKERILKPRMDNRGYLYIRLCKGNKKVLLRIHRLVAEAFLPNPDNLPQVNHKDENPINNRVENLEWCTAKYNHDYGTRNIRTTKKLSKSVSQYSLSGILINVYPSAREVYRQTGFSQGYISGCCRGEHKTAYGYIWRYKEKEGN